MFDAPHSSRNNRHCENPPVQRTAGSDDLAQRLRESTTVRAAEMIDSKN
jgi:hypothetical protein